MTTTAPRSFTNEHLKTPTVTFDARVLRTDGTTSTGRFFMAPVSRTGLRPRPEDRMNERDLFVPFLPEGARHAILLNKDAVAVVTLSNEEYSRFGAVPDDADGCIVRQVALECGAHRFEGSISVRLPSQSCRVLDFMNTEERYFVLSTATERHVIRKASVTVVSESDEGTLRPSSLG